MKQELLLFMRREGVEHHSKQSLKAYSILSILYKLTHLIFTRIEFYMAILTLLMRKTAYKILFFRKSHK